MLHQPSLPSRWRFGGNKRTHNDTLLPRAPKASSRAIMWSVERNGFGPDLGTLDGARLKQKIRELKKMKENNRKKKTQIQTNYRNLQKFKKKDKEKKE